MPTSIQELLEAKPDEEEIQESMGALLNGESIDVFMEENLIEMK